MLWLPRTRALFKGSTPLRAFGASRLVHRATSAIPDKEEFYSAHLGEKVGPEFDTARYTLLGEIGKRGYSSVWKTFTWGLLRRNGNGNSIKALKILTSYATHGLLTNQIGEFDAILCITNGNLPQHRSKADNQKLKPITHPGQKHCSIMQTFYLNESHLVFVLDLLGPTLYHLAVSREDKVIPLAATKKIIKQVLLALDFLHSECGLFHCERLMLADLKPENVLVSFPIVMPGKAVNDQDGSLHLTTLNDDLSNISVTITDFGSANWIDHHYHRDVGGMHIRPPEVILKQEEAFGAPVDIWAVGCMRFKLLTGANIFRLEHEGVVSQRMLDLDHLFWMLQYTDHHTVPMALVNGSAAKETVASLGRLQAAVPHRQNMTEAMANYKVLHPEERKSAVAFIQRCMLLDPKSRPTAKALLEDEWLMDA